MTNTPIVTSIPLTVRQARQEEVNQYQANIDMYTKMLELLPTEYPAHLLQYKNASNRHDTIDLIEDLEDVQLLSDLWAADTCRKTIRTETVEMRKSLAILSVLPLDPA